MIYDRVIKYFFLKQFMKGMVKSYFGHSFEILIK